MSLTARDWLIAGIAAAALATSPGPMAQTRPVAPRTDTPQSERTGPQDPRSTGSTRPTNETLSERLEATDGVIRPPANIAPDMTVRPPVPDPGTTPVIPPPGSPGGDPSIEPR
jgi:hypothetical protein